MTADPPPAVRGSTRIGLHELAQRPDREEWIVGRMATGRIVALPPAGKRALDLLGEGLTAGEVGRALERETGEELDIPDFIQALIGLGFVSEVDGRGGVGGEPPRPTLRGLTPRRVRFALSPRVPVLLAAVVAAGAGVVARNPARWLGYQNLLWSPHGSLVLGLGVLVGWPLLALHELAHLTTARATGVPARIRLGTRLQFLVMQTDISGIELAPRRHRLTAYLAGIAVNLTVASAAVLAADAAPPGTGRRILSAVVLIALLPLPFQLMVFMRTDLYFVLQELTGCRDLYGDGAAFAAWLARRATGARRAPADPSRRLPARERRAVRAYSAVLVLGTAGCLAALAVLTLPADVTLLARAVPALLPGHPALDRLDAAAVLVVLGGGQALWTVTWLRARLAGRRPRH